MALDYVLQTLSKFDQVRLFLTTNDRISNKLPNKIRMSAVAPRLNNLEFIYLLGAICSKRRARKRSASFIFFVARMERSVIRERHTGGDAAPDFAALHPGYETRYGRTKTGPTPALLSTARFRASRDGILLALAPFSSARGKARAPRPAARTGTFAMKVCRSWRKELLPLPGGERVGVKGFGRCKLFCKSRTPSTCPSPPSARSRASSTRNEAEGTQRAGRDTPARRGPPAPQCAAKRESPHP
jgi:hypothetical protein